MKWLFNRCRRHEANLSLLATGALPETERSAVLAHLTECAACRARFAEWQTLAAGLSQLGRRLPQVEAPASLRRRWVAAIRESARADADAPVLGGLSGQRLALGSLAATWALVLFFRFSAPEVSKPALAAAPLPSLREVLMALKVEPRDTAVHIEANPPARGKRPPAGPLPPRSQRSRTSLENMEVA